MKKCDKLYTITEYGYIGIDNSVETYNTKYTSKQVCKEAYKEFEIFAKTDKGKDVLGFARNGLYLQAKNYVGTIQTVSGYTLEILPKIYNNDEEDDHSKAIFIKLLEILYKLPSYKHTGSANFSFDNKPLLEIFITMFLEEVGIIIKKGLKSDYISKEENEKFLKGKLLISEHLKENYIHKERIFVKYDEYSLNRVENKIIKTTLHYLLKVSRSFDNQRLIRQYFEHMYLVELSYSYDADFKRCNTNIRGMSIYKNALIWAKVFLKKETFTQFFGDTIAFAILYPMEKLFENYVEYYLKQKYKKCKNIQISTQVKKTFVKKLFELKPDFVIMKDNNNYIVADAKWKLVDDDKNLFSQSDFYQLFAYHKVFKPQDDNSQKLSLRLYYPMSDNFTKCIRYEYCDETKIIVIPVDMKDLINQT